MLYKAQITLLLILFFPSIAFADDGLISVPLGLAILAIQIAPLFHILWSKKLVVCYRTGYCMLHLAILCISWVLVITIPAIFPAAPKVLVLLPLALPILFWVYIFTFGREVRDAENLICDISKRHL